MDPNNETALALTNHELAASATAAQAKAEIECAYLVALKRPRNIADVRCKLLEACKRPVFANVAEFQKPIGREGDKQKFITGPSIRFVETALQAYRNTRTSTTVVYDDERIRKVHVSITDLEENSSYSMDITLNKTVERKFLKKGQKQLGERVNSYGDKVFLVEATEDDMAVKQGAAVSKAIRTNGLRLIPRDIVEEAMDIAKKTREAGSGDPSKDKKEIFDAFAALGIKPSDLEKYLGKKIEQVVPRDMADLRKVYTSLRDGVAVWSDYVEELDAEPETLKEKIDAAKGKTAPKAPANTPQDAPPDSDEGRF